jgi:peptide/nickel transport system permease protein
MARFLARRILGSLPLVLLVLTATFAALHLAPGDPVRLYLGPDADAAAVDAARSALGLDRPLAVQYLEWLARFVRGDWGTSLAQHRAVTVVLFDALGPTLLLTGTGLLLTYLVGVSVGTLQAVRRGTGLDTALTVATTVLAAVPAYVLALGLVLVFTFGSARWGWPSALRLPAIGAAGVGADFLGPAQQLGDRLRHLVLPAVTLSIIGAAGLARFARASVAGALRQPFVAAARARGLAERRVLLRHAARNALLPLVTLLGLQLPALFSGAVFVEVIFAWPGMGRVAVQAVLARDYPVVMAVTAVFALLVVTGNLLADLLAAWSDPRAQEAA